MKKFMIAAALGATLLGGAAQATLPQDAAQRRAGPMAMVDADKDGVVTRAEALAAADRHFAQMDRNGDGKLTGEELRRPGHRGHHRPGADGKAPPPGAVTPLQTDRDGRIDKPARGAGPKHSRGHMLARLDTNRDGSVSREEFRTEATQRFDRVDANRDGRIDATEQAAMEARMREHKAKRMQNRHAPGAPAAPLAKN
ncbi:EF-hand domain-containing protein [Sphingomonas sp. PL-96]|uniref:EF-hand domain-containing protein n=1 Tax=Sphingomonas sp. PL-96 TaxID=2887201 RepID=UPI001E469D14|nr:EF-hand domain-containing protein [Sphingomonas sp. PL-96]MCC2975790.1 EF-hand domain-containing protein [Sphingomonas sp. PL-96]